MKRLTVLAAMLSGLLMLVGAKGALADDCVLGLGGSLVGGECQVPAGTHNASGTINLVETLHLLAGAKIVTDGTGIDIEISSGDFVMEATARIDAGAGGGDCPMGAPITVNLQAGNINLKPGSAITSNACSGGPIVLTTTDSYTAEIDGLVESVGSASGTGATQPPGGGTITIIAGCSLRVSDEGVVSSRGGDPGADLVHLQGCTVTINGLVESTGTGHGLPNNPANHCNLEPLAHPPGPQPADPSKDAFFTGCVEIWSGTTVTIDSTGTHKGEVNADIGFSGGSAGRGWIDIYANGNINIVDGIGNDHTLGGPGCSYVSTFAVHSNGGRCQNTDDGGLITIKSLGGDVAATSGDAIQADATSAGSNGGEVHVEALNNVTFTANLSAQGDSNGTGGFGDGGDLGTPAGGAAPIRAFLGALSWTSGAGNVQPTGATIPAAQRGEINLEGCTLTTVGATFPSTGAPTTPTTTITPPVCAGAPTKATIGALPVDNCIALFCGGAKKKGTKFNDLNNNHIRNALEPGLELWEIRAFSGGLQVANAFTDSAGNYTLNLPAGSYTVCEVPQATWTQTCPQAAPVPGPFPPNGIDCLGNPITNAADCKALTGGGVTPVVGYSITLTAGEEETGNDFGNFKPGETPPGCLKQTVLDRMKLVYGTTTPDFTVRTWLGEQIQPVVDAAFDQNGDGAIIVMVIAHSDGSLGGSANQSVVVSKKYYKPFALFGCSVTLTGGGSGPAVSITPTATSPTKNVQGRNTNIFVMDLHGSNSAVGVQADSSPPDPAIPGVFYTRYLDNECAGTCGKGANGVGIKVIGKNNTVHNGQGTGNIGDGVQVYGDGNMLDTTDAISNGGNGFYIEGDNNILKMRKAGDSKKGNGGAGVRVKGIGNQLTQITAQYNSGPGFWITGGTLAAPNAFVKNNTSANSTVEFRLDGFVKNVSGGNKADGVEVPTAAKCNLKFPVKAAAALSFGDTSCP